MVTMCCFSGQFIAGKSVRIHGDLYIEFPRAYVAYSGKHGFLNMPGNPDKICIDNADFSYVIESGEVFDLYEKQVKTSSEVQEAVIVPDSGIIRV